MSYDLLNKEWGKGVYEMIEEEVSVMVLRKKD